MRCCRGGVRVQFDAPIEGCVELGSARDVDVGPKGLRYRIAHVGGTRDFDVTTKIEGIAVENGIENDGGSDLDDERGSGDDASDPGPFGSGISFGCGFCVAVGA